jgi:SAM-dependent methyltransferase
MIEQYREFSFPLNVYAYLLDREEHKLDYLHYGLFGEGCVELAQAQAYSTRLVLDRLPATPARILEVGTGLGATLAKLLSLGYEATGVNPEAPQIAFAQARFGVGSMIVCSRWEEFEPASGGFDTVLFQESAQYIDPQNIFSKAHDLLADEGTVLILDEVALRRDSPGEQGLHLLSDLLGVAARCGFALVEHVDLSALAAPTVDHMLGLVDKYRDGIQQDLGVPVAQIDALNQSNRNYRQKYRDGRFGYALLKFRKEQAAN